MFNSRTGERTKAGAIQDLQNSIIRYVKNNFLDGARQVRSNAYTTDLKKLAFYHILILTNTIACDTLGRVRFVLGI